jgi:hypothetical protein
VDANIKAVVEMELRLETALGSAAYRRLRRGIKRIIEEAAQSPEVVLLSS